MPDRLRVNDDDAVGVRLDEALVRYPFTIERELTLRAGESRLRIEERVTNPELDLEFALCFPTDPFESLWYWQAFGGYEDAPVWNRTYNVGLEPTTAYPDDTPRQRATGTIKRLKPGETVEASSVAVTYGGLSSIETVTADGTVRGASRDGRATE